MSKHDPAMLRLVKEAFVILHDNTQAMNALRDFIESQQKKTKNRMRKSVYSSLRSIYLIPDSTLSNPDSLPASRRRMPK